MKISEKHRRFVDEYLKGGNATVAYKAAGYKVKTEKSARAAAARLLTNVTVARHLAERQKALTNRADIKAAEVVRELGRLGFSDIGKHLEWDKDGNTTLIASKDLSENERRAVSSVRRIIRTIPQRNGQPIVEADFSFKLHDKKGALDSLSKILGLTRDGEQDTAEKLETLIQVIYRILEKFVPAEKVEQAIVELGRGVDGSYQRLLTE